MLLQFLRAWLTGNVLSPALRAHFVRPKSLPAILSSASGVLAMTLVLTIIDPNISLQPRSNVISSRPYQFIVGPLFHDVRRPASNA